MKRLLIALCWLWIPLIAMLQAGCPIADPYTESRIVNATDSTIELALTLDPGRYGLSETTLAGSYADGWFEELRHGEGLEPVAADRATLTATYRLSPGGHLVVHSSLGREPYFTFDHLTISRDGTELTYVGLERIGGQFRLVEDAGYLYEFEVTESMFE